MWVFAVTTELFYKKQIVVITNLSPSSAVPWSEFTNNFRKTIAVFYVSEMHAKSLLLI